MFYRPSHARIFFKTNFEQYVDLFEEVWMQFTLALFGIFFNISPELGPLWTLKAGKIQPEEES